MRAWCGWCRYAIGYRSVTLRFRPSGRYFFAGSARGQCVTDCMEQIAALRRSTGRFLCSAYSGQCPRTQRAWCGWCRYAIGYRSVTLRFRPSGRYFCGQCPRTMRYGLHGANCCPAPLDSEQALFFLLIWWDLQRSKRLPCDSPSAALRAVARLYSAAALVCKGGSPESPIPD